MKTHKTRWMVFPVFALCLTVVGVGAVSADPGDAYKKFPGYVDFEALGIFKGAETTVEVFLKGPLLALAREAVKHDEPELAAVLDGIKLIRVNVFPLDRDKGEGVARKARELGAKLEKQGWDIAVRVREEDEEVYVYLLPGKSDEDIEGLVVMVVEDDQATFVNIVGHIDPAQIGRIGRSFNIDGIDIPSIDKRIKDRRDRDRDKRRDG